MVCGSDPRLADKCHMKFAGTFLRAQWEEDNPLNSCACTHYTTYVLRKKSLSLFHRYKDTKITYGLFISILILSAQIKSHTVSQLGTCEYKQIYYVLYITAQTCNR